MLHTMLFNPFEEPAPVDGSATVKINDNLEAEVFFDFSGKWEIEVLEYRLTKSNHKLSAHAVAMIKESDMVGDFSFEEELRKQGDLPDYL